jgi:glycosyltransferase involved in cell wall biosynthesis
VLVVMPLGELRGGVERMLVNMLTASLRAPEVRYSLFFLEDGPLVEEIAAMGFATHVHPSGRLRQPLHVARTVRAISRVIRREGIDVVLSWAAKGHIYAGPAALRCRIPSAWYVHSLPDGHWMDRLVTAIPADLVLCCGRTAELAQQRMWPRRRTRTAYIAVDLDRFNPDDLPSQAAARTQLGLPTDAPLVVMVARLQRWKGVHVFVDAAARVALDHPDAHFVVVGGPHWEEPDYPAQLDDQVRAAGLADRVRFVGLQSNVPLWMQAADVLVHASFDEPTGTVIIEGLSLGKPVVAARSAGPMEFVQDGENGRLAEPGDDAELAAVITELLGDPAQRRRLSEQARRSVTRFSATRLAQDMADAMTELTANRHGAAE